MSSNAQHNYQTCFLYSGDTEITETQFILHEENGTLLYMEKLIESQEKALEEQA
ncbi:MAG: hypothetical protein IJY05_01225 [Clostridia bacterium]|nr:hypothetical protein [Clostridia bacterium]